jgi:hypothetical protein
LLQTLDDIGKTMASHPPDRHAIASKAGKAMQALLPYLERPDKELPTHLPVAELFSTIVTRDTAEAHRTWDGATRAYLGLAAMNAARLDLRIAIPRAEVQECLRQWARNLELRGPNLSEPAAISKRLIPLKLPGENQGP